MPWVHTMLVAAVIGTDLTGEEATMSVAGTSCCDTERAMHDELEVQTKLLREIIVLLREIRQKPT